jgi:hypothetical protein
MSLGLETTTTRDGDRLEVEALLRNLGREVVTVLLEPRMSRTHVTVTDDRGNELRGRGGCCGMGHEVGNIKSRLLQPGAGGPRGRILVDPSGGWGSGDDDSWDLKDLRSETLTVVTTYPVTDGGRPRGAGAPRPRRSGRPLDEHAGHAPL